MIIVGGLRQSALVVRGAVVHHHGNGAATLRGWRVLCIRNAL